jgi:hypothetical protein
MHAGPAEYAFGHDAIIAQWCPAIPWMPLSGAFAA